MNSLSFATVALLFIGATSAFAADTTYSTLAGFDTDIEPGSYLETFDSLSTTGPISGPLSFSGNGFSYQATATTNGNPDTFFNAASGSDVWLTTNSSDDTVTFTFTSGNVTAVGGNFFDTDANGNTTDQTIIVSLNDGTTVFLTNTSSSSFAGFTSTIPITSLSLVPLLPDPDSDFPTANNLIVGMSDEAAVPEPASATLLSFGLALLAVCFWKRRSQASLPA